MARSTTETELIITTAAVTQTLWLKKIFSYMHMEQKVNTEVHVDNQAAISFSHNPVLYGKTKQFNIKLFLLRDV